MKNLKNQIAAGILALSLLSASGLALATETTFGSAGALADPSYTLEEMLTYAIQDEYAAKAEYQAIQDEFGTVRIYSNIMKAEAKHIGALLPLFETYGITVPDEVTPDQIVLPVDLTTSYGLAVEAEVNNIAMYEAFLKEDLPEDVQFVFENLQKASESHLVAYQRASQGQTGMGTTQARQANQNTSARESGFSGNAGAQRLNNQAATQGQLQTNQRNSQNGGGARGNNSIQQRQGFNQNQTCLVNPQ